MQEGVTRIVDSNADLRDGELFGTRSLARADEALVVGVLDGGGAVG
jgi:hypothetical protein